MFTKTKSTSLTLVKLDSQAPQNFKAIHSANNCEQSLNDFVLTSFKNTSTTIALVGSVVEWLERRGCNQQSLCSKPTRAILLCL